MSVLLDGAHMLQHQLVTLFQGYHECRLVVIHRELLPVPCMTLPPDYSRLKQLSTGGNPEES